MDFLKKYSEALGLLLIVALIYFYVTHQTGKTKRDGIYTIAKIIKWEPAESGSDLYIDIYLEDKIYHTSLGYGCQSSECIGRFFFIKVLRSKPTQYPILLDSLPVPDCIVTSFPDFPGWKKIPKCKN